MAQDLIDDLVAAAATSHGEPTDGEPAGGEPTDGEQRDGERSDDAGGAGGPTVYGDNAYGTGEFHAYLAEAGIDSRCKTQQPTAAGGMFTKADFGVDLDTDTVTCPNGTTVPIRRNDDGDAVVRFGQACAGCPLRSQCTKAQGGRTIKVGRHERRLTDARARQQDPHWISDYRATRPKVERKLAHLMRHRHGGRRARMRGTTKIDADFNLLAAAGNLARLSRLGLRYAATGWVVAPA